jgi:hypothetical protein
MPVHTRNRVYPRFLIFVAATGIYDWEPVAGVFPGIGNQAPAVFNGSNPIWGEHPTLLAFVKFILIAIGAFLLAIQFNS